MSTASLPRDERRRRTETSILDAARELFSELGFERVTIRAVAGRAGIDPALVMQHFGSKEGLFAAATRWPAEQDSVAGASREQLPAAALADLFGRFEGEDRESAIALMRNCLTHPAAVTVMRDEVMCRRSEGVAQALGGDEAELRAGLLAACMMGLGMARYLLELPPVAQASREDVERLMTPVLRALIDPPPAQGA
jgi:AcrR family transcriptional regulator